MRGVHQTRSFTFLRTLDIRSNSLLSSTSSRRTASSVNETPILCFSPDNPPRHHQDEASHTHDTCPAINAHAHQTLDANPNATTYICTHRYIRTQSQAPRWQLVLPPALLLTMAAHVIPEFNLFFSHPSHGLCADVEDPNVSANSRTYLVMRESAKSEGSCVGIPTHKTLHAPHLQTRVVPMTNPSDPCFRYRRVRPCSSHGERRTGRWCPERCGCT